jgi:hypothetical protein
MVWTVKCRHCGKDHGPVGESNSAFFYLRRYYCPTSNTTVFLKDNLEYIGECVGLPTDGLKRGYVQLIMKAQGMLDLRRGEMDRYG